MKRFCLPVTMALLLGACGSASQLKPAADQKLPVAPYGATARPTFDQLTKASPQDRPKRNDELLTNSQQRQPDPFDLPPQ